MIQMISGTIFYPPWNQILPSNSNFCFTISDSDDSDDTSSEEESSEDEAEQRKNYSLRRQRRPPDRFEATIEGNSFSLNSCQ